MPNQRSYVSQYFGLGEKFTTETAITVRSLFRAFEQKDLRSARILIDEDFTYTSSQNSELNREDYFKICWPKSESIIHFSFQEFVVEVNKAFVVYEAITKTHIFRNAEILTVYDGKIIAVEVYTGWDIPHVVSVKA